MSRLEILVALTDAEQSEYYRYYHGDRVPTNLQEEVTDLILSELDQKICATKNQENLRGGRKAWDYEYTPKSKDYKTAFGKLQKRARLKGKTWPSNG